MKKYGLSVGVMEDISNLGACDAKMSRRRVGGGFQTSNPPYWRQHLILPTPFGNLESLPLQSSTTTKDL